MSEGKIDPAQVDRKTIERIIAAVKKIGTSEPATQPTAKDIELQDRVKKTAEKASENLEKTKE